MLLREFHLTFGRIADEWARELDEAKVPSRRSRDEIFLEKVRGIWRGQFADTVLTIEMSPRDDKDGRRYQPAPMPFTREMLDAVVLVRQGARRRYLGASRLEFLTSLELEDYDATLFLSVYLEPLTISKEDFGRWCDEQGHQRPRFWFGEQADAKKRRKAALSMMGSRKSKYEEYEDWATRQALLKKAGKTWTDAAMEIAKEVGVDPVYLERETRRVRRERKKRESGETN